jgi:hypothetical protein
MASRQVLITRIAAAGTSFSPLPCQAWHVYIVTSAHRVEVEVGADRAASAPPSGTFFKLLVGGEPTDLRVCAPPPTTNFDGLYVVDC